MEKVGTVYQIIAIMVSFVAEEGDHPCRSNNGECVHICVPTTGGQRHKCVCGTGFTLEGDTRCKPYDSFLLITQDKEIRGYRWVLTEYSGSSMYGHFGLCINSRWLIGPTHCMGWLFTSPFLNHPETVMVDRWRYSLFCYFLGFQSFFSNSLNIRRLCENFLLIIGPMSIHGLGANTCDEIRGT